MLASAVCELGVAEMGNFSQVLAEKSLPEVLAEKLLPAGPVQTSCI
jgi:hypothetical protein